MTISSPTSRVSYTGNGSTTNFAIPFVFHEAADIVVMLNNAITIEPYTVVGTEVVFTTAPGSGVVVTIYRDPPLTQNTDYSDNDPFPASATEDALDKAVMIDQRTRDMLVLLEQQLTADLATATDRVLKQPLSEPVLDMTIPPVGARANHVLGFNSSGLPVVGADLPYFQAQGQANIVYLSAYLTPSGDQTANLQAAFDAVGEGGTLIWDAGPVVTTDTIRVGVDGYPNSSGPTSFISIWGPAGSDLNGINYNGPTDRVALQFCKNKLFEVRNIRVSNITGVKGTSIGIGLGGQDENSSAGTATLSGVWINCAVYNFDVGLQTGTNWGDASEHYFESFGVAENNIGIYLAGGFNSLNFQFNMLKMSENGIGLHSGTSDGFHVFTGSATNNTVCDFFIAGNGFCSIHGFRTETSVPSPMVKGNFGRILTLRNCLLNNTSPNPAPAVTADLDRVTIQNCAFENAYVEFGPSTGLIEITDTSLLPNPNTALPFFLNMDDSQAMPFVTLRSNRDQTDGIALHDFNGSISFLQLNNLPWRVATFQPTIYKVWEKIIPVNTTPAIPPNSVPRYGADWMALSRVRQLAEGPIPGFHTPTSTTVAASAISNAGSTILTFASVPANIVPFMAVYNLDNNASLHFSTKVVRTTATTVTIEPAVQSGQSVQVSDDIQFWNLTGVPTPGKNLRVSGTFGGASPTLAFTFKRTVSVLSGQTNIITAAAGAFFKTDVGKPIKLPGAGTNGWTDWYGHVRRYVSSSQVEIQPGRPMNTPTIPGGGLSATVGEDEPDADYIVAGIVGNAGETFWVESLTAAGFNFKSSNGTSTATVTALIVR